MKSFFTLLLIIPQLILGQEINQENNLWSSTGLSGRLSGPITGNQQLLNRKKLQQIVASVQLKGTAAVTIPHPNGGAWDFVITPTQVMAPGLQAKFPEIKTFKGINEQGEVVRIDVNPKGMHATVFSNEGNFYLAPRPNDQSGDLHLSYFASEINMSGNGNSEFQCEQEETHALTLPNLNSRTNEMLANPYSVGEHLRKFRIAITAHKSFTTKAGGVANAMADIVTIINRTNAVFERDLAVTFELIANNDLLIMTNSKPGPFRSDAAKEFIRDDNQTYVDEIIGVENYDIGHIVANYGGSGGLAAFRSVCRERKATSATSMLFNQDNIDPFILIFEHEIGHQFGGFHTFSGASCSFGNSQFHTQGACEIGSGITLLSYGGICGDNNVIQTPIELFHPISIQNMLDFIARDDVCSELVSTGNTAPSVTMQAGGFTIPINTPFALDAEVSDAENDDLTYSWDQLDPAPEMENRPGIPYAGGTNVYWSPEEFVESDNFRTAEEWDDFVRADAAENGITYSEEDIEWFVDSRLRRQQDYIDEFFRGDGPLFRSFPPTTVSKRYFPQYAKILANEISIKTSGFEILPFTTRELNFALMVRDNNENGGGVTIGEISFSVTADAGPFAVTSEFSDTSFAGLSDQTITWDVANTSVAPVNCLNVDILYSIDGGENFDFALASGTPNDGSQAVRLPNIVTTEARIMVRAADHIFFSVNDGNFAVTQTDVPAPEASTALVVSKVATQEIALHWTDNSDVEDGFIIERKSADETDFTELSRVVLDINTFTDASVALNETYTYRVAAFNAQGVSSYTNEVSISIDGVVNNPLSVIDSPSLAVLYPSPATHEVFIAEAFRPHVSRVSFFNMNGQLVANPIIPKGTKKIDISTLKKGIYLIHIFTTEETILQKLRKK